MDFKFACDGDLYLQKKFKEVIKKYNIKIIIETGSRFYDTACFFSTLVDKVYTIENNKEAFDKYSGKTKIWRNIEPLLGDTRELLDKIINKAEGNLLIYLDAHNHDDLDNQCNPVLEELNIILESKIKPIIVIHDFKVPNKDFGYNCYKDGSCLEWNYIKDIIDKIYGINKYIKFYNEEATGSKKGAIFIAPNQK